MARHWEGWRLALAWAGTLGAVTLLRRVMVAGVYRSTLEGGRVVHQGGAWPGSFVTLMTMLAVVVAAAVMGWITWSWVDGRQDRSARRHSESAGHRKVIM